MNVNWLCTEDYFSLDFGGPVRALSSAILNGGFSCINSFLNLRVDENFEGRNTDFLPPEQTLAETVSSLGLSEPAAGMMTAANLNSFKFSSRSLGMINIYCFLTSGLSNALAAGDPGDFFPQQMYSEAVYSRTGTINMAVGTDCRLTDAALAEVLLVITEAKSSVLFELGVKSTVSERAATGTGTDSALVFCAGEDSEQSEAAHEPEQFCGKHTVLGEMFAAVVREALFDSLKGDRLFTT